MVTETAIPTYVDMLLPTLKSMVELGGSGTRDEIDEEVIRLIGLTDEQLAIEYPPDSTQKGSKVTHRLAWARTYLKKFGALDNSPRGVWTLEPPGRGFLAMDDASAVRALRRADAEARRELRSRRAAVVTAEDKEDDELTAVDAEAEDWKSVLLGCLLALSPTAFERLAQRLLREAGFKNVEVLGRSGDGGIDGVGVYRPSLVSFPIFFQCKRYKDTVGPGQVRDFRGAMAGRGEKGLLITTGTFTAEAKRESTRDGAPPVELIDGSDLCELLREYKVGVDTRTVEIVEVDRPFFEGL